MPASVMPMASATAIAPAGMASMAARVEMGEAHDSGVARSSRAGTKRKVKAAARRSVADRPHGGAAHPHVAQALLEQNRRDGRR